MSINDEIELANLAAIRGNEDLRQRKTWCRINRTSMVRARLLRDRDGEFPWRAGQDLWTWAEHMTQAGDIDSPVHGFFTAGSFEIVTRINESGAVS